MFLLMKELFVRTPKAFHEYQPAAQVLVISDIVFQIVESGFQFLNGKMYVACIEELCAVISRE